MGFDEPEREREQGQDAPEGRSQGQPDAPDDQAPIPFPLPHWHPEHTDDMNCQCYNCSRPTAPYLGHRQSQSRSLSTRQREHERLYERDRYDRPPRYSPIRRERYFDRDRSRYEDNRPRYGDYSSRYNDMDERRNPHVPPYERRQRSDFRISGRFERRSRDWSASPVDCARYGEEDAQSMVTMNSY
jgi:hypothetical protein